MARYVVALLIIAFSIHPALSLEKIKFSERAGFEIDSSERRYFHFLPEAEYFSSASFYLKNDSVASVIIKRKMGGSPLKDSIIDIDSGAVGAFRYYLDNFEKTVMSLEAGDFDFISENKIRMEFIYRFFKLGFYYKYPSDIRITKRNGEEVSGKIALISRDFIILIKPGYDFSYNDKERYIVLNHKEIEAVHRMRNIMVSGNKETFELIYSHYKEYDLFNYENAPDAALPPIFLELLKEARSLRGKGYPPEPDFSKLISQTEKNFSFSINLKKYAKSRMFNYMMTSYYEGGELRKPFYVVRKPQEYTFISPSISYRATEELVLSAGYDFFYSKPIHIFDLPHENNSHKIFFEFSYRLGNFGYAKYFLSDFLRYNIKFGISYWFGDEEAYLSAPDHYYLRLKDIPKKLDVEIINAYLGAETDISITNFLYFKIGIASVFSFNSSGVPEFRYKTPYGNWYLLDVEPAVETENVFLGFTGLYFEF